MQRCWGWGEEGERYDNSPTSKIYTLVSRILSDCDVFCTLRGGGGETVGSNAPGPFLVVRHKTVGGKLQFIHLLPVEW